VIDPAKLAHQILVRLGEKRAGKLPRERWSVPIEDLEQLARAYTELIDRSTAPTGAPLYVSLAVAKQYALHVGLGREDIETARRQLAELLVYARPSQSDPMLYRARRTSTGLDISARVAPEGSLLVVTTVEIRGKARPR
jgi:hypothetical protein